jgi:hypothetical protein
MRASAGVIPTPEYSDDSGYCEPLNEAQLKVSTAIFPFPRARSQSSLPFALVNGRKEDRESVPEDLAWLLPYQNRSWLLV